MKPIYSFPLKLLRKLYSLYYQDINDFINLKIFSNKKYSNEIISNHLVILKH